MSQILIDSVGGDTLGLALLLMGEGHDVRFAIEKEDAARVGDGLVEKEEDPVHYARTEADLYVGDMVGRGSIADSIRDDDVPVIGAGRALDLLELDRLKAMDILRGLGVAVPKSEAFPDGDIEKAIRWVEKHPGKYCFKPAGNIGTDKTFLAEDTEEMAEYLEHAASQLRGEDSGIPPFLLQEFVEGAEVSSERWYAMGRPVEALSNHTIESKKFMPGNYGPAVGCMGNVVFPANPALIAATVGKLDRYAAIHRITGPLDVNCIVDKRTRVPMALEITARFGFHALEAFTTCWRMPIGETFAALAEGYVPDVRLSSPVGAAIPVSIPPYPAGEATKARGTPIVDDILDDPMIWEGDVMLSEDASLVCAGADAVVYVVRASGRSMKEAYDRCYEWISHSRLPDRQLRSDLREQADMTVRSLAKLGFVLG